MNAEQTPELMRTGRSCMKVDGKSSEPNPLTPSGKRSTMNGPRGQQRSFLSGSEKDQARRLEMLKPLRVRKTAVRKHQLRKNMRKRRRKKKKRRKRRNKNYPIQSLIC